MRRTCYPYHKEQAKQVIQDLQLSFEGSDSDVPDKVHSSAQVGDPEGSGLGHPGSLKGTPVDPIVDMTTNPSSAAQEQLAHPMTPASNPVPTNGPAPPPVVTDLDLVTSATTPAPMPMDQMIPTFPQDVSTMTTPATAPVTPPDQNPGMGSLQAWIAEQSMAHLAQSLAATQAGGDPHAGTFAGVMEGLKEVCGLMTARFQWVCLDVEAIVQKTLEEATQLNWEFTATAAQDLDLWTTAL